MRRPGRRRISPKTVALELHAYPKHKAVLRQIALLRDHCRLNGLWAWARLAARKLLS
jgi:hypothetical protein